MARQKQVVAAPRPESWAKRASSSPSMEAEQMECAKKAAAATGVSPIPKEERANGEVAAVKINMQRHQEMVWLSSDSEPDDPVQAPENAGQREFGAPSLDCTICSRHMFSASEVHEHPMLRGVGLCSKCFDFLFSSPYTKDKEDGTEEQCRWCGEGGDIVLCDTCDKVFCQNCIIRNYGCRRGLSPILSSSKWSCFCCNPQPLRVHVDRMKAFLRSVPPGINSSVRQENAGIFVTRRDSVPSASVQQKGITSIRGQSIGVEDRRRVRSRDAGHHASDGNPGNQGGFATIADLMARAKEGRRNQGNEIQSDFQGSDSSAEHVEGSDGPNASTTGKRAEFLDRRHTARSARRRRLSEAKPKEVEEKEEKEEKEGKEEKEEKEEKGQKEEKEEKGQKEEKEEKGAEIAPLVPPARTWIRPHQMRARRQEAAQRRARAEAERLKQGDELQTNLPSNTPQHRHSDTQATTGLPDDDNRLLQQRRQGEPDADPKLPAGSATTPVQSVDVSGAGGGARRITEPIRDANQHALPKFCF